MPPITDVELAIRDAFAFESIVVSTTAIGVTLATAADAIRMVVTVEAGAVKYRYDGGVPTAAVGHAADVGDVIVIEGGGNITAFQAIRRDAADATLRVTFER